MKLFHPRLQARRRCEIQIIDRGRRDGLGLVGHIPESVLAAPGDLVGEHGFGGFSPPPKASSGCGHGDDGTLFNPEQQHTLSVDGEFADFDAEVHILHLMAGGLQKVVECIALPRNSGDVAGVFDAYEQISAV